MSPNPVVSEHLPPPPTFNASSESSSQSAASPTSVHDDIVHGATREAWDELKTTSKQELRTMKLRARKTWNHVLGRDNAAAQTQNVYKQEKMQEVNTEGTALPYEKRMEQYQQDAQNQFDPELN